jgi:hypothetical protein
MSSESLESRAVEERENLDSPENTKNQATSIPVLKTSNNSLTNSTNPRYEYSTIKSLRGSPSNLSVNSSVSNASSSSSLTSLVKKFLTTDDITINMHEDQLAEFRKHTLDTFNTKVSFPT